MTENAYQALESLGSAKCRDVGGRHSWAMIGVKGAAIGTVPEVHSPQFGGYAEVEQRAPAVHLVNAFNFYATDQVNSTRRLDDPFTGVSSDMRVDYYPYGEAYAQSGGGEDTDYKFTGYEEDSGIGLYYARARYYNPAIGRFLTPDPAGQFWSPYSYAGGMPHMLVDPSGEFAIIDDLIIAGVSFTVGYVSYGISTGDWGWDAVAVGGIAAGSALLAYNTGGAAAGALEFGQGGAPYAITAATVGGAVGGASNSIGNQLYFTGGVDWSKVGVSAGYGAIGGFAGGVTGQYITSDPILGGIIGGGVSGGIQGGPEGAFQGAFWGGVDASLTAISYEQYGNYLKRKVLDGKDQKKYYEEASCRDFTNDYINEIESDIYDLGGFGPTKRWGGPNSKPEQAHQGIILGRTKYGQHMVLSKLNVAQPILVTTGNYLTNIFGSPIKIHHIRIPKNINF